MSGRKRKSAAMDESIENDFLEEQISDEEGGLRVGDIYIPPAPKPVCSTETGAPRLIITHIVNKNFKSYHGVKTLGPFHKCFTAIIGPNGSGKSNVIDSMLFVFGYRATKIRSKKISVLIHSSEKHQNVQSCSVSVHFIQIIDKEDNEYEEIPNSTIVVTRTAFKDNSSYYEVNGKRVQFKEVAKLLRSHGIDLDHNRFLILQGEVEQISMMKPKAVTEHESGMLEYLEDIIGTSRFKTPLIKLNVAIENLSDIRSEKINRVKLIEKERDDLDGPMQEAIQFLKIENSITHTTNLKLQKYIFDCDNELNETEEKKIVLNEKVTKINKMLEELRSRKKEKEQIIKESNKKETELKKRKDDMSELFNKVNNKDLKLQAEIVEMNKKRKRNKEQINQEELRLAELRTIPDRNRSDIEICERKEADFVKQGEALENEKEQLLASMAAETRVLQERRVVLETELVDLNNAVGEAKSAFDIADAELKLYLKTEEEECSKLETLKEKHENCRNLLQKHKKSIEELKVNIPANETALKKALVELKNTQEKEQQMNTEIRDLRTQIQESRNSMQSAKSRGRVLDALMQYKSKGNIPGLLGRLGDLGAIDLKYDIAISTACGPLDNIVVDTVNTAEECINYLKQNSIGRATFIALEKQEHLRDKANSRIKTPENVPRLFDLVRVNDQRLKTAFYFALRDTLVADNIEQATRVAYGTPRFRVVTLSGDLIEIVGTMSGGGKSVSRGRMGQKVTVNTSLNAPDTTQNTDKMEQRLIDLENQITTLREKHISLERQVMELTPELQRMRSNLENYIVDLESLTKQKPAIEQQLKEQEVRAKKAKSDPNQVKKLTKDKDTKEELLGEANRAATKIQTQVDKIAKEIKDLTGGRLKNVEKKLSDAIKSANKFRQEAVRLNVEIKTSERNVKKTEDKIINLRQEVKEAETLLNAMQEQRKEIEADATQLMNQLEVIANELEEYEETFESVRVEIAEIVTEENKIKSTHVELEQNMSDINTKVTQLRSKISKCRLELTQLKLHEIPKEKDGSSINNELQTYSREELEKVDAGELQYQFSIQNDKLQKCKPNLAVIEEYKHKEEQFLQRVNELEAVTNERREMRAVFDDVRKKRHEEFITGYQIINSKLKEMYQMITLGGDAELELVDTLDPFSEGITFSVRPPKKSWKNISNLSGGEKTLSSLALVFALHYYKPSPLYFMDEIDAALDFKNVSIVGNYIKDRTKNAQFIIISLRSNMFELADRLIGIYKTDNCTQSATITPTLYPMQSKNGVRLQPLSTISEPVKSLNELDR